MLLVQDSAITADAAKSETVPNDATTASNATSATSQVPTKAAPTTASDPSIALWIWLPFILAMGLWIYLRSRNQALELEKANALAAAAKSKNKKAAKRHTNERAMTERVDNAGDPAQMASESAQRSKGNSKKNKKDKLRKNQRISSDAAASRAASRAAQVEPQKMSASATTEMSLDARQAVIPPAELRSNSPESSAESSDIDASRVQTVRVVAPVAKPIFEPLRKVTASAKVDPNPESSDSESAAVTFTPARNRDRRPSTPPPVINLTPAKGSGGRFEKLVSPAAIVGGSSSNRWPVEATHVATPIRTQPARSQPAISAKSEATQVHAEPSAKPAVAGARGLGSFVKVAKPSESAVEHAQAAAEPMDALPAELESN